MLVLAAIYLSQPAESLGCYTCGVFLSAAEPKCQGEATLVNCTSDAPGCLFVTGENSRGTYYVMKKCGSKIEQYMKDGECADIQLER